MRTYLRTDEDPPGHPVGIMLRTLRGAVSDLLRVQRQGTDRWPLTRVVLRYWFRMASGHLGRSTQSLRCDVRGERFELRDHASDLFVLREVFVRGAYDYDFERVLGHQPQVVVDLGANIGAFALFASTRWPTAHVVCVEPDPENFAVLARNATAGSHDWTTVAAAVVGSPREFVTLHRSKWWASSTVLETVATQRAARPHRPEAQAGLPTIEVVGVTLPDLLAQQGIADIDLIKIDIEGAELDLLESLSRRDFERIRAMVIDVHDKYVDADRIRAALMSAGMEQRGSAEGTWLYARGVR